jgi:hypothetical protein
MRTALLILFFAISLYSSAQNQNLSNGIVFDGEPYLTVNPINSQHIVVAWMGWKLGNAIVIKTRTSFDAGQTWSVTTDIPHVVSGNQSADPSLKFDNNGNLFLCFIDYKPSPTSGAVYATKSTDGGLSWGSPTEVINVNSDPGKYPVDRPWMDIDNSGGVNDGNIYITTMNPSVFGPVSPPYNPYFIRSIDGGASFEPWRYLDTTNWLAGNLIPQPMPTNAVSSNGILYSVYPSYVPSQGLFAQYILATSINGGGNFSHSTVFTSNSGISDTLAKKGYLLKTNPANNNHLAFFYIDITYDELDVFMRESLNGGSTWSSPIKINDDPTSNNRIQDLVWADFDNDGDLIVTWRDRRNAADSTYMVSSEIYGAVRWKDSTNFSSNFPITDSSISYNTVLENNGNDFMCVNMVNDSIYVVWGDTRNDFLNIWFEKIELSTGATFTKDLANDIETIKVFPNPSSTMVNLDFGNNNLTNAHYEIFNVLGELITKEAIKSKLLKIDVSKYIKGNYLLKFSNNKGSKAIKIIKK